jgi:hypothetical protein
MWFRALLACCFLVATGCLGPLVDDEYVDAGQESLLLPPGSHVPSLHDDPNLDEMVDDNDGVERYVARIGGFVDGEHVRYWDFGPSPTFTSPVWVFGSDDGAGGLVKLPDHPVLFDVVPGQEGYTPMWQVFLVFVTEAYAGELITSLPALQEAEERGLVQPPQPVSVYVNCPVVHPDVLLETADMGEPVVPNECFYRGMRCFYFDLAPPTVTEQMISDLPVDNVYVLRREGGEPLSEPLRNVDMTGDGDLLDTNNVFGFGTAAAEYSPLVRMVEVVVPLDTGSIDTYLDETQADYTDAAQLFSGSGDSIVPVPGAVIAFEVDEQVLNLPQQIPEEEKY